MKIETAERVAGRDIPASFHLGRCEAERWFRTITRDAQGLRTGTTWAKGRGCDLAFFFRLPSGGHNADVTCPGCGHSLDITTRRLRAGFLPLTDADVRTIKAHKGQPVTVSSLKVTKDAPASGAVAPAPMDAKKASLRERAVAALAAFDAKPRCSHCWGYNASVKKHPTCGFCREWGTARTTADSERDQYAWKRQDLVDRVVKYGGVAPVAPVAGVAEYLAERDRQRAEARARRVAAGVRVR